MDCYVYYKSAQEQEPQIVRQVRILNDCLNAQMNIDLQLQRRPGVDDGMITWMEIYRNVPPEFDGALGAALKQTEIMALIQGERHAEYFEDAISCA